MLRPAHSRLVDQIQQALSAVVAINVRHRRFQSVLCTDLHSCCLQVDTCFTSTVADNLKLLRYS